MTREGQKIMMVQDNFTGTLVGGVGCRLYLVRMKLGVQQP